MSGNKNSGKESDKKKPLSHGWIVLPSKTYPDRVYFYNTVTKCSTWTNPCEVPSKVETPQNSVISHCENKKEGGNGYLSFDKNSDIEDYDEQQDQYFDNIPVNEFNLLISPPSSPNSDISFKTNVSVSDSSNSSVPSKKSQKQLWLHFASGPEKPVIKKSVALSDLEGPSTSRTIETVLKKEGRTASLLNFKKREMAGPEEDIPKNTKRRRRSRKRNKSLPADQKTNVERINNNVSKFKKRDKTPAQTRLLKLREQNLEMIKGYGVQQSSNSPEQSIKQPENRNAGTPAQTRLLKLREQNLEMIKSYAVQQSSNSPFMSTSSFKQPENRNADTSEMTRNLIREEKDFQTSQPEAGNYSQNDFMEEMDWEPSIEEFDVRNINVFRKQLDRAAETSPDVFQLNSSNLPSSTCISWFLVLDTNIFVSCLDFVKDLRDTKIGGSDYPGIYVPWRVLRELDHLKDSKFSGTIKHWNVRKSIAYLNENFKSRHPRCFGQSFEDFSKMVSGSLAPDDEILQTCLELQKLHPEKKLTLLTNDKNLESKAIVSGVEAYSKEGFQKKYLSSRVSPQSFNITPGTSFPYAREVHVDTILCKVKTILREFLPSVVETEMKLAFEGDWIKLAYKKPPWTLQDALDCFLKHWRSVFYLVFTKETLKEAERLYHLLFKKAAGTQESTREIILMSQLLVASIQRSHNQRSYMESVDAASSKLSSLLLELSPQVDSGVSTSLNSSTNGFYSQDITPEKLNNGDVQIVKNLFRDIWDSYRSFCCSMSDVIHSCVVNDAPTIQEIRLKLSQALNQIGELVLTVEKILETTPEGITERHPGICHLANFLLLLCPRMEPGVQNRLTECLSAFFKDFDGRSVVTRSLTDFREFSENLLKATEYFDTQLKF